jgi:excisionase family DNA binding protein
MKMSLRAAGTEVTAPTEAETELAKESSRTLAAHLGGGNDLRLAVKSGPASEELVLPARAARLLLDILTEMGRGNAVSLTPIQAELTTQQAANLLNVSRPHLVKLLDEGAIPSRKVGTHRRVLLGDALAYKKEAYAKRLAALEELSALDQELGLY